MLNFYCFVLFNAVKTDTKLALSKKKKVSCFSDSQLNFRCALIFKKTILHVNQFAIFYPYLKSAIYRRWRIRLSCSRDSQASTLKVVFTRSIDENKIISEWPPALPNATGLAFVTDQCRCVWPKKNTRVSTNIPKITGSVGRKFFLFFVNFLYANFRAKLLLWA